MKNKIVLSIAAILFAFNSWANNIQLANISLSGQNTALNFTSINFDISWDNSWRTSTNESNYDGAWVFAKWRKKGTTEWRHASINYLAPGTSLASGHTAAAGSILQTSADGKGVWMYRDADGIGNVNFVGNSLQWNYGVDGVLDSDSVDINVYAIEMVYIPQGVYTLGDGSSTTPNVFSTYGSAAVSTYVYNVNSNAAIPVGTSAGSLYYTNGAGSHPGGGDNAGPIPVAYPKGYNAFWLMKYECSQQQYADFLNSLDLLKATARNAGTFTGTHPNFVAPEPERAYGGVNTMDLISYADWAGMRPFTEMEYEKACRGANIVPVSKEYPWGSTTIVNTGGSIQNGGLASEIATVGNCNYAGVALLRCGVYATASSNRQTSGATYYGVKDMGGNLWEQCVSVGSAASRAFTESTHGDGFLSSIGESDLNIWRNANVGHRGSSVSGGAFGGLTEYVQLSQRYYGIGATALTGARSGTYGVRLARSAE